MHGLLAYVNHRPTKTGVSFSWEGAWEFDQMAGSGRITLRKDGSVRGTLRIKDGDSCTFTAERNEPPSDPIPDPVRGPERGYWRTQVTLSVTPSPVAWISLFPASSATLWKMKIRLLLDCEPTLVPFTLSSTLGTFA
jgi:hypothetical protein